MRKQAEIDALLKELDASDLSPLSKFLVKDLISQGAEDRQAERLIKYQPEIKAWIKKLKDEGILDEQN